MAERGRGAVEVLSPGSAVEQGAARLFARVESPLLWDLTLDWHGAQVTDVFPERLPDLYAGLPVTVLARVRDAGPVRVSVVGESPEGVRSFDVVLDARGVPEHPVVGVLWARAALEELEDDLRLLAGGAGELTLEERAARQAEVRAELVDLSLDTGLVSSATSFVVVETERTARPGGPDLHHRVTAERVAAWPQTATARPVRLSTGLLLIALGFVVALLGREPDDETADGGRREASRAC
jgi:Ca-activated chloride channel family protein